MPFRPKPNNTIAIKTISYQFTEHPSAPGMAYGQTGRRATVYQIQAQDGSLHALKVFTKAWRDQRNATSAHRLHSFASLPGLQVCERIVFTPSDHSELINTYPDLEYAVLMAWVSGETWQEVMLNGRPLTVEQSRELGLAFLGILKRMEQEGLAHCDLSGPNVLLHFSPAQVALVDVEDMYGLGLTRPEKVGGGSSGYGHKTAPGGLWSAEADRFAGAILLAEMLGWCDERVRRIGYGEQYFDPAEVQQGSERYQVLFGVLREQWGSGVADAFARAWFSEELEDCPSFQEWDFLLNPPEQVAAQPPPENLAQAKIDAAEELLGNEQFDQAVLELEEAYQLAPEAAAGTYARVLLMRGAARERENKREEALADYQKALQVAPEGGLRDELSLIVAEMGSKAESAPVEVDLPAEEKIVAAPDMEIESVIAQSAVGIEADEIEEESSEFGGNAGTEEAEPVELPTEKDAVDGSDQSGESAVVPVAPLVETTYPEPETVEKPIIPASPQPPVRRERRWPVWATLIVIVCIVGALGVSGVFTPKPMPTTTEVDYIPATEVPSAITPITALIAESTSTSQPSSTPTIGSSASSALQAQTACESLPVCKQVEVKSAIGWQANDIVIRKGQNLRITYVSGTWAAWPGGDGYPYESGTGGYYVPEASWIALVGKIGTSSQPFAIEGPSYQFRPDVSGALYLRINDSDVGDNSGSIIVLVEVW